MSVNLENSAVGTVFTIFTPIPKKGNAEKCSIHCMNVLFSYVGMLILKIFQARPQQYVNQELLDAQTGFQRGRGTRDQIANVSKIMEKPREFQWNIYFCFTDHAKAFDFVDDNKPWKILKEIVVADHLVYLLRNLYVGLEATVRTRHGRIGWLKIGKGVCQSFILSPWLFNLYGEYIMWNPRLDNHKLESRFPREIH